MVRFSSQEDYIVYLYACNTCQEVFTILSPIGDLLVSNIILTATPNHPSPLTITMDNHSPSTFILIKA